jgi:transposase
MLNMFQYTAMGTSVTLDSSDNASYFNASLTREFMSRLGVSPHFDVPGYPASTGLVERMCGTVKSLISKVAFEHPRKWPS